MIKSIRTLQRFRQRAKLPSNNLRKGSASSAARAGELEKMNRLRRLVLFNVCALLIAWLIAPAHSLAQNNTRRAYWIDANGPISRTMTAYLKRAIAQSEADGAAALIVQLNTPGGEIGVMQEMIQAMRASDVPVIVYVAPRGA